MTKTLQLAKHFDQSKLSAKVYVSEKYDGVPVRFDVKTADGRVCVMPGLSRQGEELHSTEWVRVRLQNMLNALDFMGDGRRFVLVGEVMHETYTGFKDISGVVRRKEPQTGLYVQLFDFWDSMRPDDSFAHRLFAMQCMLDRKQCHEVRITKQLSMGVIQAAEFVQAIPDGQEGWIIRDAIETFQPGKRTWGYQKVVKEPTLDLRIIGIVDGVGKNAGAVGTIIAEHGGSIVGVGAGKLSYNEREALWAAPTTGRVDADKSQLYRGPWYRLAVPRMACIKYKPDEGYTALRQPTFQYWRDDKDTPDA